MKINPLLPWLAGGFVVIVAVIVFVGARDAPSGAVDATDRQSVDGPREADADTTADTLSAVAARVAALQQSVEATRERNDALEAERDAIAAEAEAARTEAQTETQSRIEAIQSAADERTNALMNELESVRETIASLSEELEAREATPEPSSEIQPFRTPDEPVDTFGEAELPPGLGLDGLGGSGTPMEGLDRVDGRWVNPLDRRGAPLPGETGEGGDESVVDSVGRRVFGEAGTRSGRAEAAAEIEDPAVEGAAQREAAVTDDGVERYYTLPDLSTLTGATAVTALVGRIYLDDEITDPWPFKTMIGRENLAANQTDLPPEVDGMLYEGYGIGDWSLGCVRGWITAASFIFEDGTTVAAYADNPGARPDEARYNDDAIGYLSDQYGNPCVAGQKTTDAPAFLASRSFAAGLSGYATALNAEDELTQSTVNPDGSVSTVTTVLEGSRDFAANAAAAEAFAEGARWIRERQRQSFDAVYVEPGREVVVNLQSALWLDKRPNARQVRYARTDGGDHAELD